MLVNSITYQGLRTNVIDAFMGRGYTLDTANADFNVALYAGAREKLDVRTFDYGYPPHWGGWSPRPGYVVEPFTEGTVIIDVIDAKTNGLLWRGRGAATVSDDPAEFGKQLRQAVNAIVGKFPMRATHVVRSTGA